MIIHYAPSFPLLPYLHNSLFYPVSEFHTLSFSHIPLLSPNYTPPFPINTLYPSWCSSKNETRSFLFIFVSYNYHIQMLCLNESSLFNIPSFSKYLYIKRGQKLKLNVKIFHKCISARAVEQAF